MQTNKSDEIDEAHEDPTQDRPEFIGLDVVLDALMGEDFPMDKETLYYAVGDIEVPGPHGKNQPMRSVLDHMPQLKFETLGQAITAIKRALQSEGA